MVKRLISSNSSDMLSMTSSQLKQSIKASEGRVVVSENVATRESFVGDITNSEIAKAFGADLILLNGVDVFEPKIFGLEHTKDNFVKELHKLVGRPIGINLEPIDSNADMMENICKISKGRQANIETFKRIQELAFNFVCLTGNPGTGVTNKQIEKAIRSAKEHFSGLIIAGKMHSAGVNAKIIDIQTVERFIEAGADIILVPAVGTVPGFDDENLKEIIKYAHNKDTLVLTAIGTSQESSDKKTISDIALRNKICGADIQHIGDAGYGGLAPFENIFAMSLTLRGARHTVSMVSRSINR